jgi:shikimate kinase
MKHLTQSIFLIGGMGAGKTTIGRKLAELLNYEFYDSDREIEHVTGVDIPWIFEIEGEAGFRRREHLMVKELSAKQNIILATGGGTILDPRNRELLSNNGVVIYLKTTVDHQLDRLSRDKRRPLLQVENRHEVLSDIMANREALYSEIADYTIETGAKPIANVVNDVMAAVFHS